MDKIKDLLTITNADGSVKTFFDGRITATQLIFIGAVVLIGFILLCKLKKMARFVVLIAVLASIYLDVQLFSPSKMVNAIATIASSPTVKKQVVALADKSDNISMDNNKLQIKVNDTWINLDTITSVVHAEDGNISITVDGKDILISDKAIIELLTLFAQ